MMKRAWGLSENVPIVREDEHVHNYVEVTAFEDSYQIETCCVKGCPTPFRWRWDDFFSWTYTSKDPR